MRLNRGTIILIAICVIVIIGVLLLSNNQATAPGVTPAAQTAAASGPLFADLNQDDIVRMEVVDNQNGAYVTLTKGTTGIWSITGATNSTDRETDQAAAAKAVTDFAALQTYDQFESDSLGSFGLEKPAYVASLTTTDGKVFTMYIGGNNPTGNRRYVLVQTSDSGVEVTLVPAPPDEATAEASVEATSEATAEATAEAVAGSTPTATPIPYDGVTLGTSGTVYLVLDSAAGSVANLVNRPPYIPAPTATPTPTATLNPFSEVEQATMTAQFNASLTAIFDQLATNQAATATAAAPSEQSTAEATAEATAE